MIPKLKHIYNLPHVLNNKVVYLHQDLLPIVVQVEVGMLDMKMVFTSWHIRLYQYLYRIECDIDISF